MITLQEWNDAHGDHEISEILAVRKQKKKFEARIRWTSKSNKFNNFSEWADFSNVYKDLQTGSDYEKNILVMFVTKMESTEPLKQELQKKITTLAGLKNTNKIFPDFIEPKKQKVLKQNKGGCVEVTLEDCNKDHSQHFSQDKLNYKGVQHKDYFTIGKKWCNLKCRECDVNLGKTEKSACMKEPHYICSNIFTAQRLCEAAYCFKCYTELQVNSPNQQTRAARSHRAVCNPQVLLY